MLEDAEAICEELGIKLKPMTFAEADSLHPNVDGYDENCQSAVVVYEARRTGIDITALPFIQWGISDLLGGNSGIAFVDKNGKTAQVRLIQGNKKKMAAILKKAVAKDGRFHVGMNFNARDGHIIVAEKIHGQEVIFYDPQDRGITWSLGEIIESSQSLEILRVDNLCFNHEVLRAIARPL